MKKQKIFLALGANIGDSIGSIQKALKAVKHLVGVYNFKSSYLYSTSPVSPIPQNDFINCACSFEMKIEPWDLLQKLQKIEIDLGKVAKKKEAPRVIDIDIIFFGDVYLKDRELTIPHSHWKERLFVLKPLSDLVSLLELPIAKGKTYLFDLEAFVQHFPNFQNECVEVLSLVHDLS